MSQFARATFDVAGYLACRPSYPARLYDIIYTYHSLPHSPSSAASSGGRFDRALDIGCGPGFIALELSKRFQHVLGVDPAKKMVDIGLQPEKGTAGRVEYKVGSVEDLVSVGVGQGEDGVDLVVAGQAAHWFDYPKAWAELTHSVRRGGTVAFIGYAEMLFPSHPHLNHLVTTHSSSSTALGPFWSQPGRSIVEGLLDRTPFPVPVPPTSGTSSLIDLSTLPPLVEGGGHSVSSTISELAPALPDTLIGDNSGGWDSTTAVRLKSDAHSSLTSEPSQWLLRKTMTLSALEGYFRTWSSLHAYHERYPDDAALRKGGASEDGDIVDRLLAKVKKGLEEDGVKGLEEGKEFEVGWPLVLMMIKKKP